MSRLGEALFRTSYRDRVLSRKFSIAEVLVGHASRDDDDCRQQESKRSTPTFRRTAAVSEAESNQRESRNRTRRRSEKSAGFDRPWTAPLRPL